MNILHILSGDFVTGSETSTAALIGRQARAGHKVFVAAGSFNHEVPARFFPVPIHNRNFLKRVLNVWALGLIIRREKIDLVHAHSRAASWVSYWACRFSKTAYLSTLHGRQHLHFSNRYFNAYGPRCICVCENIRDQMLEGTHVFKPSQLTVIRNGFEL